MLGLWALLSCSHPIQNPHLLPSKSIITKSNPPPELAQFKSLSRSVFPFLFLILLPFFRFLLPSFSFLISLILKEKTNQTERKSEAENQMEIYKRKRERERLRLSHSLYFSCISSQTGTKSQSN